MSRWPRLALICILALVAAGSASADTVQRKQSVDAKIAQLRAKIADADRKEDILTGEIAAVTSQISGLQDDVDSASAHVARLESELAVYKNRLAVLTQLYQAQTERLKLLRQQHALAERRLQLRLVALYETEEVSTVELVLSSGSLSDMIDSIDLVNQITTQDRSIVTQVKRAKGEKCEDPPGDRADARRRRTDDRGGRGAKETSSAPSAISSSPASSPWPTRAASSAGRWRPSARRKGSAGGGGGPGAGQRDAGCAHPGGPGRRGSELLPRAGVSSAASSTGGVSVAGFIWPVSGSVASPFGFRCLAGLCRMHEGIDIGAGSGTPIHAAASGTVIFVGWMGGYGNLVVIDHGNGLSTAYAHQSTSRSAWASR